LSEVVQNIRLIMEYDGSQFCGWQRQHMGLPTIQAHIEDALSSVLGRKVVVYGASRTDSGVHARGQVAHFYTDGRYEPERWRSILNFTLPSSIRILESSLMPRDFHAQKDVISKIYTYRLLNRPCASALDRRVLFYPGELDWAAIRASLPHFVGEKDFRAFQGAKAEVRSTVRRVLRFELKEEDATIGLYRFEIEGTGFLKQMVRTIIGTVLEVGEGKRLPEDIDRIFASQCRKTAGRTAPANGLCLESVYYPECGSARSPLIKTQTGPKSLEGALPLSELGANG
jgi:tRNA pseudouridine38-40 synthase